MEGQSDRKANYEDEYHDDAGSNGKRSCKNEAEAKDVLQDLAAGNSPMEVEKENGKNHVESIDQDVLAISVTKLLSAQEALESEVQKLAGVGNEASLFLDEPSECINMEGYNYIQTSFEEFQSSEDSNSKQNVAVHREVENLKTKLEEEMLKQIIEVEVQYIAISEATGYVDQMEVMAQQKKLASEQVEMMKKLKCAEKKAAEVKRQAEKLEMILEEEQVWKLETKVCRLSSFFTVELILFLLVMYLFYSSHKMEIVPT